MKKKFIHEAEYGSRSIPCTTNLFSLLIIKVNFLKKLKEKEKKNARKMKFSKKLGFYLM